MKETEKAYLAGLIDADGSITFSAKDHDAASTPLGGSVQGYLAKITQVLS